MERVAGLQQTTNGREKKRKTMIYIIVHIYVLDVFFVQLLSKGLSTTSRALYFTHLTPHPP